MLFFYNSFEIPLLVRWLLVLCIRCHSVDQDNLHEIDARESVINHRESFPVNWSAPSVPLVRGKTQSQNLTVGNILTGNYEKWIKRIRHAETNKNGLFVSSSKWRHWIDGTPPPPFNKKTWKNEIKLMVYEYKLMVYEYPFTDKFGCCSLYDREGAEETKANTKQIFYTII